MVVWIADIIKIGLLFGIAGAVLGRTFWRFWRFWGRW